MSDLKTTTSEETTLSSKGYNLLKFIGQGAYAKVYLTEYAADKNTEHSKFLLACKIIETAKAPQDFVIKFLPREIDVLIRLNHPHLIHVHSIFQRRTKYYIFMRYGENGDLLAYILKNGCVSENQARVWMRQLALGIQYLHEMEITHRDMKCENILLTSNYNVKISDFGFARFCVDEDDVPILSETYCGSLSYAAPEILRGKPYAPKPTDVWSLGVVMFVMLNKAMPFDDTRMRKLYEQQMSRKYKFRSRSSNNLSVECKTVVKHVLDPNPAMRYSADKIIKSEWISMDSRLTTLNVIEAAALKRAKEDRKKLSDTRKGPLKRVGDILDRTIDQSKRVNSDLFVRDYRKSNTIILVEYFTESNNETIVKTNFYLPISCIIFMERESAQTGQNDDLQLFSSSERATLAARGYKIVKKLNEGSYAKVYLVKYRNPHRPDRTSTLACKMIDTKTAPKDFVKKFLPREIEMLINLEHPHLVHTHSIFQRRHKYFIFMRYMERGDMLDYVLQRGAVSERQARLWARQLALAVQYMHELDLAHRDIKCENVLITLNLNVKLSDFGFSRSCIDDKMQAVLSSTFCGSLSYTAPEILQGAPYSPKPTDIWSLGVVVYVMLNRAMPFEEKQAKQLHLAQLAKNWRFRSRYAVLLSDTCRSTVALMLEPDITLRLSVEQLLNGDWIAMDSRLLELTTQEVIALKKAKEERKTRLKNAEEKI